MSIPTRFNLNKIHDSRFGKHEQLIPSSRDCQLSSVLVMLCSSELLYVLQYSELLILQIGSSIAYRREDGCELWNSLELYFAQLTSNTSNVLAI